jgi:hypothetical protein
MSPSVRIASLATLLLVLYATPATSADLKPTDRVTVRIVPMTHRDDGVRGLTLWNPALPFHVVVTNVSNQPLRLWREWCSWGYYNLSFEVTDEDGKTTTVKKKQRGWRKNYPDWFLVAPSEHMVFDITLDESVWENPPLPEKGKSRVVKMRAVLEIPEDADTKGSGVWTGKVVSPEHSYTIYR